MLGKEYSNQLLLILNASKDKLLKQEDDNWYIKPLPNKWSPIEILGHLIDSALNNHRRFLLAQKKEDLIFAGYDPDTWVQLNNYQNRETTEVISFWEACNIQLAELLTQLDDQLISEKSSEHNFHKICMNELPKNQSSSLAYLIRDYLFHVEYHLNQIIPNYDWVLKHKF